MDEELVLLQNVDFTEDHKVGWNGWRMNFKSLDMTECHIKNIDRPHLIGKYCKIVTRLYLAGWGKSILDVTVCQL